jgi:putative oxidoreductase
MGCGTDLQRLFSTFANGWPGRGLLLLRSSVFAYLVYDAFARPLATPIEQPMLRFLAAAAGVFLMVGLWTPVFGGLAAILELGLALSRLADFWPAVTVSAVAAGLAMLGPGAWSFDARLFGRERISIQRH